jgi:carbamoyl-phosphate synthase large subunit
MGNASMNVLFTSAGRRVVLMRAFRHAMDDLGISGRILATDLSATAPALYEADRGYVVPRITSEEYIPELGRICNDEDVRLIIPTIDPDLPVLAASRNRLEADTGRRVVVSPPQAIEACQDKTLTAALFDRSGVKTPRLYAPAGPPGPHVKFPVFAKLRAGYASIGAGIISDVGELQYALARHPDLIVQEYVPGPEYTCDVLCSLHGKLIAVVTRRRLEVRAGEVTRTRTETVPSIVGGVERVCANAEFHGPITLQCILHQETQEPVFFEINPRFGGGVPAAIAAGANYPRYLLEMVLGRPVSYRGHEDGLYMLRYEEAIYVRRLLDGADEVWRER